MAEGRVVSSNVYAAANYFERFFTELPTDKTFKRTEFHKFLPVNSLESDTIEVRCKKWDTPTVFHLADAHLELAIKFRTLDGGRLPNNSMTSTVNNLMHSMFRNISVSLNSRSITTDTNHYGYCAYLTNLLSYSSEVKTAQQQGVGWYSDATDLFDAAANPGFTNRRNLFSAVNDQLPHDPVVYSEQPVTFCGKIMTDLTTTKIPIPPGVSVDFEFVKSDAKFAVMSFDANPMYELKIVKLVVHIPCSSLSEDVWNRFKIEREKRDVVMHFTRRIVGHKTIRAGSRTFESSDLFPDSQVPSRILICFVLEHSFRGHYNQNPFNLIRTHEGVHLVEVKLLLNDNEMDSLKQRETPNDCMVNFIRLHYYLSLSGTPFTNGIGIKDFMGGNYLAVYSLNTSGRESNVLTVPQQRYGGVRLEVEFSGPITEDYKMIIFSEVPSILTITKSNEIGMSYL